MANGLGQPVPFLALKDGAPLAGAVLTVTNALNGADVTFYSDVALQNEISGPVVSDGNGLFSAFMASDYVQGNMAHALGSYPVKWMHNDTLINVRHLGARGDGVTDDRAAIQAAMDMSVLTGGWCYFPPGDYGVDVRAPAEGGLGALLLHSGCRMKGDGETSRMVRIDGAKPMLTTSDATLDNIVLKDFQVDFNDVVGISDLSTVAGKCIHINPSVSGTNILCDGLTVRNTPLVIDGAINRGVGALWLTRCFGASIVNCLFANCDRDALDVDNSDAVLIANNRFWENGGLGGATDGSGDGDDNIRLSLTSNALITGNVFHSPNHGRGRGIWVLASKRIGIIGNTVRSGWRSNITVETSQGGDDVEDVLIAGNTLDRAGEWSSTNNFGDAVHLNVPAPTGSNPASKIRKVQIVGNKILSPRRHGINLTLSHANARIDHVDIVDNHITVDRSLSHIAQDGNAIHADLTLAGQAGEINNLELRGNRSEDVYEEGVYLKGSGIKRARLIGEKHYGCGQVSPNQKCGYHLESLVNLHFESCVAANFSGEARSTHSARFYNNTGRVRIVDYDGVDMAADVDWQGTTPATYVKRDNWGAADLP